MTRKLVLAFLLAGAVLLTAEQDPVLRFAVVADVQYADKPAQGKREYRESKAKLTAAVTEINRHDVNFVIQLADLIDAGVDRLDALLSKTSPDWRYETSEALCFQRSDRQFTTRSRLALTRLSKTPAARKRKLMRASLPKRPF